MASITPLLQSFGRATCGSRTLSSAVRCISASLAGEMDSKQKLDIRTQVSLRTLQNAIQLLEKNFIASRDRELIVRLLKLVPVEDPSSQAQMELDSLISTFHKSTYQLKYINAISKQRATELLQSLKKAFHSSDDLNDLFNALSIDATERQHKSTQVCFQQFLEGRSLASKLVVLLQTLKVYSFKVNEAHSKVAVFGSMKEVEFWEALEKYKQQLGPGLGFPSFQEFKTVVNYYGGLPQPFAQLDALVSGGRFPFSILDNPDDIPKRLFATTGTIGGFMRVDGSYYAVTAARVVSAREVITDHPNIYRGMLRDYYMDIAFLKIRNNASDGVFNPLSSLSWDYGDYTDYWATYLKNNLAYLESFQNADSFAPGTDVQNLGFSSGHTSGHLLDTLATAHFGEQDIKRGVVAIRSSPDRPFSKGNDSGSVYCAVFGCMRYPIAVHFGSGSYYAGHPKAHSATTNAATNEVVSFGTRLREAVEWWLSQHEEFGEEKPQWFVLP